MRTSGHKHEFHGPRANMDARPMPDALGALVNAALQFAEKIGSLRRDGRELEKK